MTDADALKGCNLSRFPRIGRRYLAQLAALPADSAHALREYPHGDYRMLYIAMGADATVYLLSILHHRQLSLDFAGLWPGA